ncbi:MAG: response regulator [Deltaproteobacteria bacterium]|nr:response regulator [Deltaproteobacteria bacterium]
MNLRTLPLQVQLGAAAVLLFGAFCVHLLVNVTGLRGDVELRVSALIELQSLDASLDDLKVATRQEQQDQYAAVERSSQTVRRLLKETEDPDLVALEAQLLGGETALRKATLESPAGLTWTAADQLSTVVGETIRGLRTQTGALSRDLGTRWNRLGAVVFASLALCGALLALMLAVDTQRRRSVALADELKSAYAEVATARDAAQRADEAKGRLLATVSHELRAPMNGVIGMADLLRGTSLQTEQRELLDVIHTSGTLLMTMVEQLLDFSLLERKELPLRNDELDLLIAVEEAIALVAPRAADKGVELSLHWAADLPRQVYGDGPRLRQVVLNLVGNATKFTDAGRVEVRVASARSDVGTAVVRVEVEDTGAGVLPEEEESIFDAFSQGTSDRQGHGAGLGLTIVKRLVEAMDGQVGLESTPGEGSTFWFSVPLVVAGGTAPKRSPRLKMLGGRRVLVADPDPVNRAVWEEELSGHGAAVSCFAAHDDLLDALAKKPFVVSLAVGPMDAGIGDRLDAVRKLWPQGPVVLTAPLGWSAPSDLPERGVVGVIRRPLRPSSLASRLVRLVSGRVDVHDEDSSIRGMDLPVLPANAPMVLVADDNEVNRRLIGGLLRTVGYDVRLATNGFEAVDQVLDDAYLLVLMDCRMPDMDGFEATARIREEEGDARRTPIIALTGDAVPGDHARFREAGMDGLLVKPISPEALRAEVRKWAGKQAPGASAPSD